MPDTKSLYDEDFVVWSLQQADALRSAARAGSNQGLDWTNLAEEIEDLGKSLRIALRSQVSRIIQHLAKLEFSPAANPRAGWRSSIREARDQIQQLLEDSPSLRPELDHYIAAQTPRAVKLAADDLNDYGELETAVVAHVEAAAYTQEQILGDWFPPEPKP
jgi:hypothetical protein